jgi:hypothetical protein
MTIIDVAKKAFYASLEDFGKDPYGLRFHVPEVERWCEYLAKKYPEADAEVLILGAWLHDIGHYPVPTDVDHAIRSEERAKELLEQHNYSSEKLSKVLHVVRAHRCKDVLPETPEAKLLACADSASHITDPIYLGMAKDDKKNGIPFRAYDKMERDFRDLAPFPDIQEDLKELLDAWKILIQKYEKIEYK